MIARRIETREGRHFIIERGGQVICQANSTAETAEAAILGGVATRADWRRQGLASAVMTALCGQLLSEGKKPCLFFENEEAGRIYSQLGFAPDRPLDIDAASEGRIALTFLFLSMRSDGDARCRGKVGKS